MKRRILIYFILFLVTAELMSEPLSIPPLLDGSEVELTIQEGSLLLPFGESSSLGFNGNYLGPTLRFEKGDDVSIYIKNTLREDTTVHWHGLHVPAEFDGGPHQIIRRGEEWNPRFQIRQAAATLWYHPHMMGKTGEHVYRGLAGLFIIEDNISRSLDIPQDYGKNDFPLILQDRRVGRDGQIRYRPAGHDIMHGYLGNVLLTNGSYQPELSISGGTYRFRILNGSNSSLMRISFNDNRLFTVIASDGGFLPLAVKLEQLILSPGERYEILVDFSDSEEVIFQSELYGGGVHQALMIKTDYSTGKYFDHPSEFPSPVIDLPREWNQTDPSINRQSDRSFIMETRGMGGFSISGRTMDMERIDFSIPLFAKEQWLLENPGTMNIPHSFHVHDTQFRVLSLNGAPPPPELRGPKDTVLLMPGASMEIFVAFGEYEGVYMYHCHLLEHEDQGMMGQFEITP